MTLTLLIDLDDTLLYNDMGSFIPQYLKALSEFMDDFTPPDEYITHLLSATETMSTRAHPDYTLKETFDAEFYPKIGLDYETYQVRFTEFINNVFPDLCNLTQVRPEAKIFVDQALARGFKVGIATNPYFPRAAILERLIWAGFPQEEYSFTLISSYEEFHFVKPNPAYFAEFLGQIGWPDGPVVMVGNDPNHDITSARQFCLPTYRVTDDKGWKSLSSVPVSAYGGFDGILEWLDNNTSETLTPNFNTPIAIKATLLATPASISTLLSGVPNNEWLERKFEDEWNITEIICHLRDVDEEVNKPRLNKLTSEENPQITGIDTDAWAKDRNYSLQDGKQALHSFISTRLEILELLDRLEPTDWERSAHHSFLGPTCLLELIKIITQHDRLHIQQIYQMLK
jgi:FMN phosphatase YigB (HAD superfamily)